LNECMIKFDKIEAKIKREIVHCHLSPGEIFFLICFLTLSLFFIYFRVGIAIEGVSLLFTCFSILADSLLIILPFIFLKGWKRFLVFIPIAFVAILVIANLLYYRNFGDIIGGITYISDVTDIRVLEGTVSSFTLSDIYLLIVLLIPFIALLPLDKKRIAESPINRRFKTTIIIVCILSWVISLLGSCRRFALYREKHTVKEAVDNLLHFEGTWIEKYNAFNFTGYGVECVYRIATKTRKPLSDKEKGEIENYLSEKAEKSGDYEVAEAGRENLIIIVVESLQSNIFDFPQAEKIAPTLVSIAKDTTNLFVKECRHLAGPGRSSDAQFVINTGLLPLLHEALVANYADGDYPSIAKAFHGDKREIIGEESRCWFHSVTTQSYGYDHLQSGIANDVQNQDSIIFSAALKEIPKMQTPFFLFLSTISMHDPYLKKMVTGGIDDKVLASYPDRRDKEYLRRVSFFDSQLSDFLNKLKKTDVYDNTLIVIVGDHEVNSNTVSEKIRYHAVPLFILGEGSRQYRREGVTQLDIFPTILSLLKIEYIYKRFNVKYTGLGKSLFDLSASGTPTNKDYEISDLIIRRK
ncbi:MAG: sulfatase-like hydrolase/transferase, partial [Muribaculaceae bacterium]|nr:sulfatase-like hydrolase/transferase [Muribaculaceae bacterium]